MRQISISVRTLLEEQESELKLELVAGLNGLDRRISVPRIQKPGLALAGYANNLHPDRIQVLGSTELSYICQLPLHTQKRSIADLCALNPACLIITKGQEVPEPLQAEADRTGTALLRTSIQSSAFISQITKLLEERLLPCTQIHGVLVDILGVGVLITGKSSIGKSECALELILRGHRLVADDVVKVRKKLPAILFGEGEDLLHYHMEIRGLGIINIKHLFGVAAIRERKKIDMIIELEDWDPSKEYDRLGLDEHFRTLLDVELPLFRIPVRPGRNISTIIEVAARNQLLKEMGYHSAREFQDRLEQRMAEIAELHAKSIIGDNLE